MIVESTDIPEVLLVKPKVFGDTRGYFFESFQAQRYKEAGITCTFVQDNISRSSKGILRGLHFQRPYDQAKLIGALKGAIFDVAVDVRHGSPTFGKWVAVILSDENKHQLFIPRGFAHGFLSLSDEVICQYKVDEFYQPSYEHSLQWNDPQLNINWPTLDVAPQLSSKDMVGRRLMDFAPEQLPLFSSNA